MLDQAIAHGGGVVDAAQVRDMLGLADRSRVLELFEKTMRGDAPSVVAALAEMHDSGADPVVILQDLLELTHWVTRLKVAPEAAAGLGRQRARPGPGHGGKLSMASLTRAWTLLMKGLQETLSAPSPLRAAEMALIRLCYAADLPSPVRRHQGAAERRGACARRRRRRRPHRVVAEAAALRPVSRPSRSSPRRASRRAATPNPKSFTEIVALFEARREARLVHSPDASRARGALRAGPDRVPARSPRRRPTWRRASASC